MNHACTGAVTTHLQGFCHIPEWDTDFDCFVVQVELPAGTRIEYKYVILEEQVGVWIFVTLIAALSYHSTLPASLQKW